MTIPRRKFLSMMAVAPFITTMLQRPRDKRKGASKIDPSKNFYVWIHGIFGITFKKHYGGIALACPSLIAPRNLHLYKVGRVTAYDKETNKFTGVTDIPIITTFRFEGLENSTGDLQTAPGDGELTVKGTLTYGQPDMIYFELPYPQSIIPLRFARATGYDTSGGAPNKDNPPPTGERNIPLCHVLEYDEVAATNVKLTYRDQTGTKHTLGDPSQYNHFHLYAEPDPMCYHTSPCHNADGALEALLDCYKDIPEFGLKQLQRCPALLDITGFATDLKEQFGLFDWAEECRMPSGDGSSAPAATITAHECPQLMVSEP